MATGCPRGEGGLGAVQEGSAEDLRQVGLRKDLPSAIGILYGGACSDGVACLCVAADDLCELSPVAIPPRGRGLL